MPRWYDSAIEQLENDLQEGAISDAEFEKEMRNLNSELQESAQEAADHAYSDVMCL